MKPNLILGILLVAAGIVALVYQGFTYTSREKVLDIGAVQVTADKTKSVPIPPILGAIAIVGGVVLLVAASKRS